MQCSIKYHAGAIMSGKHYDSDAYESMKELGITFDEYMLSFNCSYDEFNERYRPEVDYDKNKEL